VRGRRPGPSTRAAGAAFTGEVDVERTVDHPPQDRPGASLTSSARGWHGVQLAALAFIGLCGVLTDADPGHPRWLQVLAGVLALAALVLACVATYLVARVAWPLAVDRSVPGEPDDARRLRIGVALTFVAVATMALSASSGWWPAEDDAAASTTAGVDGVEGLTGTSVAVRIIDTQGRSACGTLAEAPSGALRLVAEEGTFEVPLSAVASLDPVDSC
jgi:hypothetical protein